MIKKLTSIMPQLSLEYLPGHSQYEAWDDKRQNYESVGWRSVYRRSV